MGMLMKLTSGDWERPEPVRYGNVWERESTSGPPRLRIGPASGHVELLLNLAELWGGGYYLLWVLLVPRQGKRLPGRYQSPGPLSIEAVETFCRRFAPFFQGDGRQHL